MEDMRLVVKAINLAKSRRINQAEFARQIGVDPSRLSEWKKDQGKPSIDIALRMARTLGVSLDYLADDAQDEPPATSEISEWERAVLDLIHALGLDRQEALRRLVTPPATPTQHIDPHQVIDPRLLPQPGPMIPPGAPSYKPETPRKKQPG